jgi:hypothetical protein
MKSIGPSPPRSIGDERVTSPIKMTFPTKPANESAYWSGASYMQAAASPSRFAFRKVTELSGDRSRILNHELRHGFDLRLRKLACSAADA